MNNLDRSVPPIEPMWKSIIGGLILVAFCVTGFLISDLLARL